MGRGYVERDYERWMFYSQNSIKTANSVKGIFGVFFGFLHANLQSKRPQYLAWGDFGLMNVATSLYIKLTRGQTPKGEVEKNYLICYPTWEKKETSCKEIG